jgi:hypothetical protein
MALLTRLPLACRTLLLASLAIGAAAAHAATNVFLDNFDAALPAQVDAGSAALTGVQKFAGLGTPGNTFSGNFLRSATGNLVSLTLTGLPTHSTISVAFLFAAIDSLDGTGSFPSGDFFRVTLDGQQIFRESFANATPSQFQSYVPAPGVELARHVDLGFSGPGSFYTDSAYDFGAEPAFANLAHTSNSATFTFQIEGQGIQDLNDESWAMDNLRVSVSAVPEPATAALWLAGLGLMGLRLRNPRASVWRHPS